MSHPWNKNLTKNDSTILLEIGKKVSEFSKKFKHTQKFHNKYWEWVICPICENKFERRKISIKPICCSVKCSYIYRGNNRKNGIEKSGVCLNCGMKFNYYLIPSSRVREYCSHNCSIKSKIRSRKIGLKQKGIAEKGWVVDKNRAKMKYFWNSLSPENKANYINNGIGSLKSRTNSRKASIGRKCANNKYKRGFFRKDLNYHFRSSWEANVARIFNYLGIEWDYEIARFKFNDCSYCPDFYLPYFDTWIEIKGYLQDTDKNRLRKMVENFPDEKVKIIDGEIYNILKKKYSKSVVNWEY